MQMIESAWLAKTQFLGTEHISIGDLQVCAELEMLKLLAGAKKVGRCTSEKCWCQGCSGLQVVSAEQAQVCRSLLTVI